MSANRTQPDTPDQPDTESMTVTRHVDAPPQAVFALLCDPVRHRETEPTDWVRDAIDTAPITRAGQIFAVNMFLEQARRALRDPQSGHRIRTPCHRVAARAAQ